MTFARKVKKPGRYPHPSVILVRYGEILRLTIVSSYLSGNFAPINAVQPLTPCDYWGTLPAELAGGEYVRNGGNPLINGDLARDAHWFDGDGMLSGVFFPRQEHSAAIQPEFVNRYVLTDVYLSSITTPTLKTPILPSITTLVNPLSSLITIALRILRTLLLVALSHLPGSQQAIKRISVANTAVIYHDGRALATCESGPPMRISLPRLETAGWYNGQHSEGEGICDGSPGFGGQGFLSFMREWTTAHVSKGSSYGSPRELTLGLATGRPKDIRAAPLSLDLRPALRALLCNTSSSKPEYRKACRTRTSSDECSSCRHPLCQDDA